MTSGARNCVHCGPEEAAVAARERVRRSCLCILCLFRLITELFHSQATTASIPRDHLCRHCTLPISNSSFSYFDQKGAGRISILGISTAGAELHVVWHVNWSHLPPGPLDVGLYQSTFLSFSTKLDPADSDVSSHSKSCQMMMMMMSDRINSVEKIFGKHEATTLADKQERRNLPCGKAIGSGSALRVSNAQHCADCWVSFFTSCPSSASGGAGSSNRRNRPAAPSISSRGGCGGGGSPTA